MHDIMLFESDLGTLDTSNLEHFFSCSAAQPCTIFKKMYGGSVLLEKDKVPMALGSCYLLCTWKIHCSKTNSYILF